MIELFTYYKKTNNITKGKNEYFLNQYEDYNEGRFYYKEQVNARYIEQSLPEYKDNLLIEGLPPSYTIKELLNILEKAPLYSEEERQQSVDYRVQALFRLEHYLAINVDHIELACKIDSIIRRGYASKRIFTPEFVKKINFTSNMLFRNDNEDRMKTLECIPDSTFVSASGLSIVGVSGGGKSAAIEEILSLYPSCIVHNNYKNEKILFKQVPGLIINCSHNGSPKGVCKAFFEELDGILGSEYQKKHGNRHCSIEDMFISISHLSLIHGLGLLVIDEIQHLTDSTYGKDKLLNFLVTLENKVKVPIVLIGTYKAVNDVLTSDFREARRASGIGEIEWKNMKKDAEWNRFIKNLWKYQWTKNKVELNENFIDLLYDKTMGITDRVIKLFIAAQLKAILCGFEEISSELIREIADKYMFLTKDMILALKENDINKLAKLKDIKSTEIDNFIENMKRDSRERAEATKILEKERTEVFYKKVDIKNELKMTMLLIGVGEVEADKIANFMIEKYGLNKDIAFLKNKILNEYLLWKSSSNETKKSGKKSTVNKTPNSIKSDKNNTSWLEEYNQKGLIKHPEEDFCG